MASTELASIMSGDLWRVLTVKQPWAAAIAEGVKRVENRSMNNRWRGRLAIHAGAALSERGMADERIVAVYQGLRVCLLQPSAVVAVADLVDVHPDAGCCRPWGESEYHDTMRGGQVRLVWHYMLEDIRPVIPTIDASGKLGLWRPDPDLAAELDRA